jgi:hypothetical protein
MYVCCCSAGDSDGKVHLLDPRAAGGALNCLQLHKPGSKVNAVAVNPAGGASVVLTAGVVMSSWDRVGWGALHHPCLAGNL